MCVLHMHSVTRTSFKVRLAYCKEAGDAKKMLSKDLVSKIRETEAIMCKLRELVPEAQRSPGILMGLHFGEMQLAAYTLGVTIPGDDMKYKDVNALAHDIVVILSGIGKMDIPSPWASSAQAADQATQDGGKAPKKAIMRELNEDGSIKDCASMLSELGFEVGNFVRRSADGESGKILSVEDRTVRLQQSSGVSRVSVDTFLSGEWSKYIPKADPQTLTDLMMYMPSANPEYKRQIMLANCCLDVCELNEKFEGHDMWKKLTIQIKPRKCIRATAFIGKGKLTVVPAGLQLKHSDKQPEDVLFPLIVPDLHVWIPAVSVFPKQDTDPGFVNPCFYVQPLNTEADCNMQLSYVKSSRTPGVKLPVLKNIHDLREGDTLYMFKPKKAVAVEALQSSPPKRQRTKGPSASAP